MSSWSSEQLKFNGEDFDYDMDYLLFGKYAKLNSHTMSNNCHSGQSSVYNVSNSMTRIMNTPFCLPNPPPHPPHHQRQHQHHNPPSHRHSSMHPMNSALPPPSQPMIITDGWRNTDLCLDNFNYTTGSVNMNQLCEENVHLSRNSDGSNNHSDEYLHDDSDVEPKLNLTDPLMTDIAVGDLDDNSPISTNEYEMLLMPASSSSTSLSLSSSSSSSSNGYNGCYSHPNSVCSTPTEVDLFNSSIPTSCSTNYTNTNHNNNNNSSLASTMECGSTSSSSSSSSTSSGSCRSFQSSTQQLYNCGNSLMKTVKQSGGCDTLLYISTDNTPTTTISSMSKTPSPVVTAAPSPSSSLIDETMKQHIEQSSDDSNHARRSQQQYEEGCGLFSTKSHGYNRPPVWQMRYNRKQQQQPQQQQHSNNSPAVSLLTRFRHQHHQHHPSSVNQAMKRRFTSPLKKVTLSSVNERSNGQMLFLNAGYSTPPLEHCNYSSSTSSPPIPLQMTNNNNNNNQHQHQGGGGSVGGEHIPFPSHHQHDSSSTYTFQLSPSLSECHYNEKAFYYTNTTTNSNNMSSMLNGDWLKNEKHDLSCVHSTPLSSSKSISNMNNTASTHSITTTTTATNPTTDATNTTTNTTAATTNSVVCKSPSRNYSITPPNPVQKRLHLLQFISKILQYSSPESPLFTSGASSSSSATSSSSSSHHHHRSSAFISPPVVICSSSSSSTPASVSVSSSSSSSSTPISTPFYSANNQQDELIPHLFTMNSQFLNCVQWIDKQARIFQIRNPQKLSQLWGYYRKNENMTFESVSRSLRLYYVSGKLERIRGQRNQYRFLDVNI